jgi:stage V sporulation protein SpoVS
MTTLLNITSGKTPLSDNGGWTGYIVENGKAHALACCATTQAIKAYADREGFDGVLIGGPSVPWATQ